jgi:hypothetical protein
MKRENNMSKEYVLEKLHDLDDLLKNLSDEDLYKMVKQSETHEDEFPALDTVSMLRES